MVVVFSLLISFCVATEKPQQLTQDFFLDDFRVQCPDKIPKKYYKNVCQLAQNLQVIQNELGGKKIKIISGYRSPRCNRWAKGAKRSQHMRAKAADIRVKGMSTKTLKRIIEKLISEKKIDQGGVGLYRKHVHYDVRGYRSRWRKSEYVGICK